MKSEAGERELTQDSRHSTLNQKDCTSDNPGIPRPGPEEERPKEGQKEARSLKRLQSDLVNTNPIKMKNGAEQKFWPEISWMKLHLMTF